MRTGWMASLAISAAIAVSGHAAGADGSSHWPWDQPEQPVHTAAPAPETPANPACAPQGPDGPRPKECADAQTTPDSGLEDALAPPSVAGPSGNRTNKKAQ